MKKSFSLTSSTHKPDRQVELVKHEINKYLGRERRKALPEGVDYWDFACKIGATAEEAVEVHVAEIGKQIDKVVSAKPEAIYVEILSRPATRNKKSKAD